MRSIPRQAFRQLIEKACQAEGDGKSEDEDQKQNMLDARSRTDGIYKAMVMSSGKNLTSRKVLPVAEPLGLAYEYEAGPVAFRQNQ